MKNILTTILVLFALSLNAQTDSLINIPDYPAINIKVDRDTFTICNNVQIYTIQQGNNLSVMSNLNFLDEVDLNGIKGVAAMVSIFPSKIDVLLNEDFKPASFTEDLLDTLSMFWCGELFERTPTGLKQDTIYNYGNYSSKEVDSLKQLGNVVIESRLYTRSDVSFYSPTFDTITIEGLSIYLCDEDFDTGVDCRLVPTKKVVRRDVSKYAINPHFSMNGYHVSFDKPLQVYQYTNKFHTKTGLPTPIYEWREIDLTKYKEFIFIEKPK